MRNSWHQNSRREKRSLMKNGRETAVGKNFYAIRGPHIRRFRADDDAANYVWRRAEGAQPSAPSFVEDGSGLDFHSHLPTVSEYKEIHFKIAGGAGCPVTEVGKTQAVLAYFRQIRNLRLRLKSGNF